MPTDENTASKLTAVDHFHLSQQHAETGDFDAAVLAALRSLEGKTDRQAHYEQLGRSLISADMPRAAEMVVLRAFAIGFERPVLHNLHGRSLFRQKRYEEAIAAMEKAIEGAANNESGNEGYVRYRDMIRAKLESKAAA